MLTLIASKGRAVVLARQKDSLSTCEMCTVVEDEADLRHYIFFIVNIVTMLAE